MNVVLDFFGNRPSLQTETGTGVKKLKWYQPDYLLECPICGLEEDVTERQERRVMCPVCRSMFWITSERGAIKVAAFFNIPPQGTWMIYWHEES